MNRLAIVVLALLTLLELSSAGRAQQISTVGDILSQGGKKLTKDETQKIYSGSSVSGIQINHLDTTFKIKNAPDGSVTGDAWHNGTWFTKVSGNWSIGNLGEICLSLTNTQGNKIVGCNYYFALGTKFYASMADSPPTPVYERQITR